ncbi:helix-turn-helix transcriptional regulator [Luteolibacter ambystomatis]|uniref:Helix-turn-helix transcriptional regulator n=1 Tax=Luteolibacter ambystomatis TaxID=2824561 RepID=A0A975G6Y7_9BACT|nr:helix-turn-helix transcriptional regulator [Luteolibacter ambystomatis]QUE49901.1 helix-turn-helix transcriptional regulator [Luteolibacter ambystomatis]
MPSAESEAYVRRLIDLLRHARTEAGLSQQKLAALSGVDLGVISRAERHERIPGLAALRDLAIALQLDWGQLCSQASHGQGK